MEHVTAADQGAVDPEDPAWYKAATLPERVGTRAVSQLTRQEASGTPRREERRLSEQRLAAWRSDYTSAGGAVLEERLATEGLSEEGLRALLDESGEELRDRLPGSPVWVENLMQAYREAPDTVVLERGLSEMGRGLLLVAEPVIRLGRRRLREGLENLVRGAKERPFEPATAEEMLVEGLEEQLALRVGRTMVLELNVARVRDDLRGATPEHRFEDFVDRLRHKGVSLAIMREYPVLARQLATCVNQWVTAGLELARRLCEDWDEIKRTFYFGRSPGKLVAVEDAGDQHRGGRSVRVLGFESGSRLVYKPRSVSVDAVFQRFLVWVNERGEHPPFRTLEVLDLGTHGWVEFVQAAGCHTEGEVRRFYRRQGGYLALFYALHAVDFHMENLIACGEHPVPVDLEALFHPGEEEDAASRTAGISLAAAIIDRSVLGVGMLPRRIWTDKENKEGLDVSGLGGMAGQLSPRPVPHWENVATDEMRLVRKRLEITESDNRPTLRGSGIDTLDHAEDVIAGFGDVYRLLARYQAELLSERGPLHGFTDSEVRYIARPTQVYAMLLIEGFHPDLLRDGLRRERFFDRLWPKAQSGTPGQKRLFVHERRDLQNGDIPAFSSRPSSRDLWSSSGGRIEDHFKDDAMTRVRTRIGSLCEEDLTRQTWFVRASLTALTLGEGRSRWLLAQRPAEAPDREASRSELLAAAREVGDRLALLAVRGEKDAAWLGLKLTNERAWMLVPADVDLYDGLSGIALFLGYLGAVCEEDEYTGLARGAVTAIRDRWKPILASPGLEKSLKDLRISVGAFDDLAGTVYALTHLGELWNMPELLDEAEALVGLMPPFVRRDETFDMLGGAAGCICVLLGLHNHRPQSRALEVATLCGEHLISHARRAKRGVGWTASPDAKPLTGFSHGAAGISCALLELSAATGEIRFERGALRAIAYERAVFSPRDDNWPDLRAPEGPDAPEPGGEDRRFMAAWCHGAPGIGLGRLRALKHLKDGAAVQAEIEAAVRTAFREGLEMNHSLCHGSLGNLELPLEAGIGFDDSSLTSRTYRSAFGVLESIRRQGWICGVPEGVETPGLMVGLAGIGYGLLRLAARDRVPSVLTLEPPRSGARADASVGR